MTRVLVAAAAPSGRPIIAVPSGRPMVAPSGQPIAARGQGGPTRRHGSRARRVRGLATCALALALASASVSAQRQPAGPARAAREAAPVDLTGYWVSVVTEDWRWRMVTPPKGDYASVPLNDRGREVANTWDPAKDEAAGEQCRAYGAAGLMRVPGRVHIAWADENTLRIETEAGAQTRLIQFGAPQPSAEPTWQGVSRGQWELAGGTRGQPVRGGGLKVVTTHLRPGYLRKNGVPYSDATVLTEYINRVPGPRDEAWLIVTTIVDDPRYLQQAFITSTHFKRLADGAQWHPSACAAR